MTILGIQSEFTERARRRQRREAADEHLDCRSHRFVAAAGASDKEIAWTLQLGSKKISTRFVSVQVGGSVAGLFDVAAPRVRVELRDKAGVCSIPVSASYGFDEATRDVQLRFNEDAERAIEPDTVTLQLDRDVAASVTVHLLDAGTGRELARFGPVDVVIAF
jgi:hypothetical protein